ncbi:hypothetical protein [Hyphomonas sp.]|uniref:hypothetical protein n=1 Tax=Hyphomonas sp. TaxID=87 RepID=UPI00391C784D
MGTPMTLPDVAALVQAAPVTSLLAFLAGDHAAAIARIWPSPHEDFLALPAPRRHAAAMLLARGDIPSSEVAALAMRARRAEIAEAVFGGEAPAGLMRAVSRMGEVLWRAEDYARFLRLFAEEEACLLIRHTKVLDPAALARIEALPPPLRQPAILGCLGADEAAMADIVAAWAMALRIRGAAAAPAIAQRFGRAASAAALFEMARQEMQPQAFCAECPSPDLLAPFEAVRSLDALSMIAHEFRNCLREFVADIASGRMAVHVWRGEGGPAAVALRRDPGGWRLAEARGVGNADLADAPLRAIIKAVEGAGVRTGESWNWLYRRIEDRACEAAPLPLPDEVSDWRRALFLGNYWD